MVRIPFTRAEVGILRLILRLLCVEKMYEILKSARDATREQASDSKVLGDLLVPMDVWHMHDRVLQNMCENVKGEAAGDEIGINMSTEPIEFYRGVLTHQFEVGEIISNNGDVFSRMVDVCKKNQALLLAKINRAVAQHELQTIPTNVFRVPQGRN